VARTTRTDATETFFAGLAERAPEPLLRKASGSARFDVVDGRRTRRWLVTIDGGRISAAPSAAEATADCVVRADKAIFDKVVSGRMNAVAAVLRGDLVAEGDWRMVIRMQRLFPGRHLSRRAKKTT
jgi:putative sterol carrier protein